MKFTTSIILVLIACFTAHAQATIPSNYKLVYAQNFEQPQAIQDFEMTDAEVWRVAKKSNNSFLELFMQSNYKPLVRSPFNIALLKTINVEDFILEVKMNQNGREYPHRDLCLIFGFKNASNFYYTHIASKADNHANSIFIVNDAPRVSIAKQRTDGTNWGTENSWHTVRVVRNVASGLIQIYFDDNTTPIMQASDKHFKSGYIGLGSFDDVGRFDDVKIWAPKLAKEKQGIFK